MAGITQNSPGEATLCDTQPKKNVDAIVPKKLLVLQGPVGPFFNELCSSLRKEGHVVDYIALNSADYLLSSRQSTLNKLKFKEFDGFIKRKIDQEYDALVLFGANRPAHQIARKHARESKKNVFCFEEGYIRPGYISLELGGNNASSPVRNTSVDKICQKSTTRMQAVDYKGYWPMVFYGARYYLLRQLTFFTTDTSFSHRNTPLISESFHWTRGLLRKVIFGPTHRKLARNLISKNARRYYIVSLQVPDDSNVVIHSNGWDSKRLITEALTSFSKWAPKNTKLVFKIHPMARGHSSEESYIYTLSERLNVRNRTVVLHEGSLGELTKFSSGMITINSTAGLSALYHGVPLLAFGSAIYTNQYLNTSRKCSQDLDRFWWHREIPKSELRNGFLAHLRKNSLVPGDFYSPRGRMRAVKTATQKINNILNKSTNI